MKYKTHVIISSCYRKEKYFYLVQGIEYPNLITEGDTIEEAIKMCIDAWSLLCVVYEDKKIQIKESSNDLDINEILSKTDYQEYGITKENSITVEIESEDTTEYRKECTKQEEEKMDIFTDSDRELVSKIIKNNEECNIDWVKNHKEFIGFMEINSNKYMIVLKRKDIEFKDMQTNFIDIIYRLTIYNLTTNKKYELQEDSVYGKLGLIKELYDKICEYKIYRRIKTEDDAVEIIP